MNKRWINPNLFKVQLAPTLLRGEGLRKYTQGLIQFRSPELIQFRWLLAPFLGLPRQPFTLWRNRDIPRPGGDRSLQELANQPGWEPLEVIGLPVDTSWNNTGYSLNEQGPINSPLPPIKAALQRLNIGAPRAGWQELSLDGASLPDWEPSDFQAYLKETCHGRLLNGIHAMLRDLPNGLDHKGYVDTEKDSANPGQLNPRLLLNQEQIIAGQNQPARCKWSPLGLLLLGAGTDPLAALALGFGTALNISSLDISHNDVFMVSVRHQLTIANQVFEFELADVVSLDQIQLEPSAPSGLSAKVISHNRPQAMDGPALETVGITWDRLDNKNYHGSSIDPISVSYAVGRISQEPNKPPEILLTRRSPQVNGWFPFVASKSDNVSPTLFADHIIRSTTRDGKTVPSPKGLDCTYAVAAQDIFGRWSPWSTVSMQGESEQPQIPSVLSVKLELSGELTIDFSWDWSDRSPEFIELTGNYEDEPSNVLFTAQLQFGGNAKPNTSSFDVTHLKADLMPATDWGQAQDRNPNEPEVRYYRLKTKIPVNFAGKPSRFFEVQARGQCYIHQVYLPGWNVSPFCSPVKTQIFDPTPPQLNLPEVEIPQWASLPDMAGVSRMRLKWKGDATVDGYVLYEATETTLLAAFNQPGPDMSQSYIKRLGILRSKNIPSKREVFRRVQKELIPPAPEVVYEVELPRGSTVLHFYALTAMSPNQEESAWPNNSKEFIAVAVPRLAVPVAPTLEVDYDTEAAHTLVSLQIGVEHGVSVSQVEIYRVTSDKLATSVDTMGPPIATLSASGPQISFIDSTISRSWKRVWYRVIAWSARDEQLGVIEARSPASSAVPVLLPPQDPPDVINLKVNLEGSNDCEVLIGWTSHAPGAITPLGPHTVVVEACKGSKVISRIEDQLDKLIVVDSQNDIPPADPKNPAIILVGEPDNYHLYTWIPRPAADQSFRVTVKMIDPLGRIGSLSADVPPIKHL
ncbi:hypothetical protein COJ45_27870 [Bacillus cereus]|nr:hypothetical protein COJ45_27870 [Bacillus cereus]